jgi:thiosulfate dehydrogenase
MQAGLGVIVMLVGCGAADVGTAVSDGVAADPLPAAAIAPAAVVGGWVAPDPATIPAGPLGDAIREGRDLALHTFERRPDAVGNRLHCSSCHLQAGTVPAAGPWVGITAVFPEYRARNARVNLLEDRINDCFERSLNGRRLAHDDPALVALEAYMTWLSQGQPVGVPVQGRGFPKLEHQPAPDAGRGEALYGARCAGCHGADGQGLPGAEGAYAFPPLWGPDSFNLGAGMARLDTATAFVQHNMPMGQGGTLSAQEAVDVAAFFTAKPRPDFARKGEDWPAGGRPRDARY